MALSLTHAALPYPVKHSRFSVLVSFRDTAGALTNPTSPDSEVSTDGGGTFADCAEEVSPTAGHGYITLTGAETNNDALKVQCKGTGVLTEVIDLYPRDLPVYKTGTAQAGAASTITLAAATFAADDDMNGCIVRTTGGTGGGGVGGAGNQARLIIDSVAATQVCTVQGTWETNPGADTTYDILVPLDDSSQAPKTRALLALPAVAPAASGGLPTFGTGTGQLNVTGGRADADLKYVWGATLTEAAGAGKLAGALSKFLDVTTPLLVASDVMRGTDSAALASVWTSARGTLVDQLDGAVDGTAVEIIKTVLTELSNRTNNPSLHDLLGIPDTAAHTLLTDGADAVWDEASAGHTDAGKAGAQMWTVVSALQTVLSGITSLAAWLRGLFRSSAMDVTAKAEVNSGAGTYNEATDSAEALGTTVAGNNAYLVDFDTNGVGVASMSGNVIGSTQIADAAITAAKIATGAIDADALAADGVAEIADGVWDEARAGHVAVGSFGEGVASVQGNVTGSVGSVTGGALEATLTAIKGAGWTVEHLKAIYDLVATRLATSGYTAPDNTSIGSIWTRLQAVTDADSVLLDAVQRLAIVSAWAARTPANEETAAGAGSFASIMGLMGQKHKVTVVDNGDDTSTLTCYKSDGTTTWFTATLTNVAPTATTPTVTTGTSDTA